MSLARQIVMLLDLATEPLSVRTLVAQITALGGDAGADAVHKRMHQMKAAGQARKEGDGWVLVDALPLQNLRAKWAREGQPAQTITQAPAVPPQAPTLRDRIVQALRARPGITAKELAAELGDLAGNEPASTLNILALDIEDLIGRACDQQADYRAIKALAGAAGMVRRAQLELLRAA